MPNAVKSIVKDNYLLTGDTSISVGSQAWFEWLSRAKKFSYKSEIGSFAARREKRRKSSYWYAYRRVGKVVKTYLGKTEELTPEKLEQAALSLAGQSLADRLTELPGQSEKCPVESRINKSILLSAKISLPELPNQLLPRPRLTRQIQTPITLISAPSGFGKSTLLNDWRQTCGIPVAWLSLDDSDNHLRRFWYSVLMALQTINPELGRDLLAYLDTESQINFAELVAQLTNDLVHQQMPSARFSLVLDNFQRINQADIYDSIQTWLDRFPPGMQLVILGHTNPPFSLGHLRANGLITEMDANDLRFTLAEGIDFLHQVKNVTSLSYDDLARLVRHSEGWAAGLTLAALALSKQENQRQFVDTFSGTHIYIREYFMETVMNRCSIEVQDFLFKTAILKQLTGSLCDAVTGRDDGEEMLFRLWQDNLFIVRLDERGWYRYHNLFAEMLLSQLQAHFPHEVPQLHKRAARWYRAQYASTDAVYHLLASEAWDEAALLMEEMALRELEQFGEDSRLLRWLQGLPASVVQKHKVLLIVYLRLGRVSLPRQQIERFIHQIETSLSSKPASQRTRDEQDVFIEIQRIQSSWQDTDPFTLPFEERNENAARWELLNGMRFMQSVYSPVPDSWEDQVTRLFHQAQTHHNLYLILLVGGVLAAHTFVKGQFRRSEKIARQVLELAVAQRGKLPETGSIALAVLSHIYLERNNMDLAEKYLTKAMEIDPNPTSSNILVQFAVQRTKMHMARGHFKEALDSIKSIRDLHARRPSGAWKEQDLFAYEAFVYIRKGDVSTAEQILIESEGAEHHGLLRLVHAEVLLEKKETEAAEKQLSSLVLQYPNGIRSEPLMRTRILLARALFEQHRINQALQVMKKAIRLAAPEKFFRPFVEGDDTCMQLLSLLLQTDRLTKEHQAFVKNVLRTSNYIQSDSQISQAEMTSLSISASISPREQEVLRLISAGYSNREIADGLSISQSTVKTHVGNIYNKLNVNSRIQAINRAKELGLV